MGAISSVWNTVQSGQGSDADLTAIAAFSSTGIAVRTGSNTWAQRTIAAGASAPITVTNGDGVSGNPTLTFPIIAHGTQTFDLDIECGTYDADVTTSANRDVRGRVWSNANNGEGRYVIRPLPGRTGGNVTFRLWTSLGVSGAPGEEVAWRLATGAIGIGDTLAASLPNTQTVYQDVSAQTAHVLTAFDITCTAAWFDQTKRQAFILERLASSDARDDYAGGSLYLHAIDLIYTGWGPIASPSAPS